MWIRNIKNGIERQESEGQERKDEDIDESRQSRKFFRWQQCETRKRTRRNGIETERKTSRNTKPKGWTMLSQEFIRFIESEQMGSKGATELSRQEDQVQWTSHGRLYA